MNHPAGTPPEPRPLSRPPAPEVQPTPDPHPLRQSTVRSAALWLAVVSLSGCASVFRVDNQVQSFARWSEPAAPAHQSVPVPQPPQTYRFERLPSQVQTPRANDQDQLEALAQDVLAQRGWSLAAAGVQAPWVVAVTAAGLRLPRAPWESPWDPRWSGFGPSLYGVHAVGQVAWSPVFLHMESPYVQREVSLVVRQASSGRVVYETRAAHDGRWNSTPALWRAMLEAAMQGFPQPLVGPRQVDIEIPR
jgi:hypothetical protein